MRVVGLLDVCIGEMLKAVGQLVLATFAETHSHAFDWSQLAAANYEAHGRALAAAQQIAG